MDDWFEAIWYIVCELKCVHSRETTLMISTARIYIDIFLVVGSISVCTVCYIFLSSDSDVFRSTKMAVPKEKLSSRRKLALIIVNGSYSQPYNRLEQVADNAKKISNSLKQINFDVATFYDLNKQNMTTCFMDFSEKIRDGDLVFVYFSGHACQVKGNNYFIPVQVEIESDRDIEDFSVNIERQLGRIAGQNPSWLTIFIVDCCKPYMMTNAKASKSEFNSFRLYKTIYFAFQATSEPKCLSKIEPPTGVFVEFACSIDEMIEAGPEISRSNLFAKRLLQNITRENVDFTNLFQDIADEVYKESGRRQRPFSMNGFRKRAQVYLNEVIKPPERKLYRRLILLPH